MKPNLSVHAALICSSLFLFVLHAGCQDDEPESGTCDTIAAEWEAFVADHQACSTASDCTVVAGTGTCDCADALGEPLGDAISTDALDAAQVFLDRYESCLQEDDFSSTMYCDFGQWTEASCEQGVCVGQTATPCMM